MQISVSKEHAAIRNQSKTKEQTSTVRAMAESGASMDIDTMLVSSMMMDLNVAGALKRLARLSPETRESAVLCSRLPERLRFLREELANNTASQLHAEALSGVLTQFTATIDLVFRFLEKIVYKKPLARLAASRAIRDQVRVLHGKIDAVFTVAGLSKAPEMVEWKQHEAADITTQHSLLEELVGNPTNLVDALTESSLVEALTELKFEINSRQNPGIFTELMTKVLGVVVELTGTTIPDIPSWFIRRDEVEVGRLLEYGSFGVVNKGIWRDKEVCVKVLYMDETDTETDFLKEATVWYGLAHPNIVKLYGGCHVGKPLFFVSEYVKKGNFVEYFGHSENNNNKMWRLFYQVAKGLAYLHSRRVVHGALKCSKLLVGEDGVAKISPRGRTHGTERFVIDIPRYRVEQSLMRWQAPECLLEQGRDANPTFKSDVYSLGMSIIEAKIGGVPWGIVSDDQILDQLASGEGYLRPERVFTDREWRLVQAMTAFDSRERMTLSEALETLAELALDDEESKKRTDAKRRAAIEKQFDSGILTGGAEDDLERVIKFIQNVSYKDQEAQDRLVQHVRQAQLWSKQESVERKNWEANTPTTTMCDGCGTLNPLAYPFCCNCGSLVDGYRSREEAAFRFVVTNRDLEAAVHVLLELERDEEIAASLRERVPRCSECRAFSAQYAKFCGNCGIKFSSGDLVQPEKTSVQIILRHEIVRLQTMMQISREEEVRLLLLKTEEPKVRACSECSELNPEDEIFCRECGNDIEIARRHKKL